VQIAASDQMFSVLPSNAQTGSKLAQGGKNRQVQCGNATRPFSDLIREDGHVVKELSAVDWALRLSQSLRMLNEEDFIPQW